MNEWGEELPPTAMSMVAPSSLPVQDIRLPRSFCERLSEGRPPRTGDA